LEVELQRFLPRLDRLVGQDDVLVPTVDPTAHEGHLVGGEHLRIDPDRVRFSDNLSTLGVVQRRLAPERRPLDGDRLYRTATGSFLPRPRLEPEHRELA